MIELSFLLLLEAPESQVRDGSRPTLRRQCRVFEVHAQYKDGTEALKSIAMNREKG